MSEIFGRFWMRANFCPTVGRNNGNCAPGSSATHSTRVAAELIVSSACLRDFLKGQSLKMCKDSGRFLCNAWLSGVSAPWNKPPTKDAGAHI